MGLSDGKKEKENMTQKKIGALVSCASNGVLTVDSVKRLISDLEKMGYNFLELCIDDTYKIDSEPFFGYLRGGYTHEEICEMDSFAAKHGIELIPDIQTLGHLVNLVKHPCYADIVDIDDILMIDEPKTYELIDKMFAAIAADFTTRKVNIGFDEAHKVGLGRYLDKHGYTNRYELLLRHLNKVVEIAAKYGFKVHMWSDMFYRLANKGEYCREQPNLPQEVIEKVPDVELCYWDYYNTDEKIYDCMLTSHEKFGKPLWFACSAWTHMGFAPLNHYALRTIAPAMKQVAKHNVDNVIVTLWGDDGNACSYFSALPVLYAAKQYAEGNFDDERISLGFNRLFNLDYDAFMTLDLPNKISVNADYLYGMSSCKAMLFNDPFLGWKDSAIGKTGKVPFDDYAKEIKRAGKNSGEYKYLFDNAEALCNVLSLKYSLGVDTRRAYKANDRKALAKLIKRYVKAAKAVQKFRKTMQNYWYADFKPYGWEINEVRFGGLISRLYDCSERIKLYLSGKTDDIPELNETIIPSGDDRVDCNVYKALISVSQL